MVLGPISAIMALIPYMVYLYVLIFLAAGPLGKGSNLCFSATEGPRAIPPCAAGGSIRATTLS